MHRGLVHALAWSLATGAAVTLSWWGVHTVMAGTAYDPPRALPITGPAPDHASATASPSPSPTPSRTKPASSPPPSTPAPSRSPSSSPPGGYPGRTGSSPAASGRVKSYNTKGGRVVFDLGKTSATLVSATPDADWSMQVWTQSTWIRVEFSSGADRVSVFCTWHDHPPQVDINSY
ncbi:hypothetical protein ACWCP6_15180 [Streptomyces sp. NPDC002004]